MRRPVTRHPVVLRDLEVVRVTALTPSMVRISAGGPELGDFSRDGRLLTPFRTEAFDDQVKLFLARPGEDLVLPRQADGKLVWAVDQRTTNRDYTVRDHRPAAGEVDIDVVLHEHGLAATWAAAASPGDHLHIAGPGTSHLWPRDAPWHLLVGDDTALPAIGRFVEETTAGMVVGAVVEVDGPPDEQPLDAPPGCDARVVWVHRDGRAPGTTAVLADAVAGLELPAGDGWAWVAGEHGAVRAVERHLVDERGLATGQVRATGYWKRGPGDGRAASRPADDDD